MEIVCSDCGIEGIHACLGKPVKQEDLPEGVILSTIEPKDFCNGCGGFVVYDKTYQPASSPPKYRGEKILTRGDTEIVTVNPIQRLKEEFNG